MTRKTGINVRCIGHVDPHLRSIIVEFIGWMRSNYVFVHRVAIYIREQYMSKQRNENDFSASFIAPFCKDDDPFIRVNLANRQLDTENIENLRYSVLISIAHEITHYFQWIADREFSESEAEQNADQMVEQFIDERGYNLTVSKIVLQKLRVAEQLCDQAQYEHGIKVYLECLAMGCDDEMIYNQIGYYYNLYGRYHEAITFFNRAAHLSPESAVFQLNKGYSYYQMKNYHEALACFQKSISLQPCKEAHLFVAEVKATTGHLNVAIHECRKAIGLDQQYEEAYNLLGQLLCQSGEYEEAESHLRKAIALDAHYADAYYNLAVVYATTNRWHEARDLICKTIKLDEEYVETIKTEDVFKSNYSFIQLSSGSSTV